MMCGLNCKLQMFYSRTVYLIFTISLIVLLASTYANSANNDSTSPQQPVSSRAAFLRAQRASRQQQLSQQTHNQTQLNPSLQPTKPIAHTNATTTNDAALQTIVARTNIVPNLAKNQTNRTTRTADVFKSGEKIIDVVTNTCEKDSMHVNIKTSRPFYGVIHTRNQRNKTPCTVEANGETEFNLDISLVLNEKDPAHCGAIRARKDFAEDKDILSVILAVRIHRTIELPDDKFFILNCTNRCTRPDCSSSSGELTRPGDDGEREGEVTTSGPSARDGTSPNNDECTLAKNFPWVVTLLTAMAIIILGMLITLCVVCSSFVCKCVKTEIEDVEPSVYGGISEDEDDLYNKRNHPMRIDYDNRNIYKTGNNYEPYTLDDINKSRKNKRSYR